MAGRGRSESGSEFGEAPGGRGAGEVEGGEWSGGLAGHARLTPPRDGASATASAEAVGSPPEPEPEPERSRSRSRAGAVRSEAASSPVDPVQQTKDICLRQLTVRPRTRVELAQALARKGVEEDVAELVLSRLDEVGLIDDAAFAEVWVRSRHNFQGLSRRALAMELRRKGVADESAEEALATVDSEAEEERARQLVRKRLRALGQADEPTKVRKLVGMLARKGYAQGLAYRVVKDEVRTSLLDDAF